MKYGLIFILGMSITVSAQVQRYDNFAATTTSASGIGNLTQVIPNAIITVFNQPAAGVSCAGGGCVAATTFTSRTGAACGGGLPLTRPTSTTCLATADSQGNFGFWAAIGVYQYCVAATSFTTQCYNVNLGAPPQNVRIIDGTSFAQTAAGINAADADLGTTAGEIWIPSPSLTASDAQISISTNHTLRVFGNLKIDAVGKGPILLNKYSRLTCNGNNSNGGGTNVGQVTNVGSGTIGAMVQAAVQDGSLETFYVDGCQLNGGGQGVSRGIVDMSGMNDKGWVRDNLIISFSSGFGIFLQDIQTGFQGGSSNSEISGNWVLPGAGSAGCLEILHSATNLVILQTFHIRNNECQLAGASSTIANAPIIFQNTSAGAGNLRFIDVNSFFAQGVPAGQPTITINGLEGGVFTDIWCGGSGACINIPNNTVNQSLVFNGVHNIAATNTLVDTNNSVTITTPTIGHYLYINTGATSQSIDTFTNILRGYGTGALSLGSDTGFNRLDTGGVSGRLFRPLNSGNGNEGMKLQGFTLPGSTNSFAAASQLDCRGNNSNFNLECSYNNGSYLGIPQVIPATSAAFATATTAGTCVQNTTSVTGATTAMSVLISPVSTPGVGAIWSAFVSSAGNVTINECAVATSAGGTIAFNIRVIP